jgi:hypothetical protein
LEQEPLSVMTRAMVLPRLVIGQGALQEGDGAFLLLVGHDLRKSDSGSVVDTLDPAEPVRRYDRQHPGELIHIDIKKLGRIDVDEFQPRPSPRPRRIVLAAATAGDATADAVGSADAARLAVSLGFRPILPRGAVTLAAQHQHVVTAGPLAAGKIMRRTPSRASSFSGKSSW